MSYKEQLDMNRIPTHIAIIMDGNGRWAKQRGLSRSMGHQQGVETVTNITTEAVHLGVKYLTLYTFSTENWKRPAQEVASLMHLVLTALKEEIFMRNNVRLRCIGDTGRIPREVMNHRNEIVTDTKDNSSMTMVLAFSYSSRWELTEATKCIAREVKEGTLKVEDID